MRLRPISQFDEREPGPSDQQLFPDIDGYSYDDTFFRYIQEGSRRSAEVIVPLVANHLRIESILDVGCGAGAWLAEYRRQGIPTCVGVDGDYVNTSKLLIPPTTFVPRNVGHTFDLGRRFDLVQCLEVGEHLEPGSSRSLVENLVRHSDLVLFSAAVPGQGGENHTNEQPYEFWRALFAEHDYAPHDFVRPLVRGAAVVEIWYRQNTILYVAKDAQASLSPVVAASRVPDGTPIKDISGIPYRLRKRTLALLPVAWISRFAILKHRTILFSRLVLRRQSH